MAKTFTENGKTYTAFPTGNYTHVKTMIGTITNADDFYYEVDDQYMIKRANIKTDRLIRSAKQLTFPEHTKMLNDAFAGKAHIFEFKRPVLLLDADGYVYQNAQGGLTVYCFDSSKMEIVEGEWKVTA